MLDIGWTELLVVGVVALVVIGPNELPRVLRTVGQSVRKLRRMAGEFQGQFNEALREAELSDLKDSVSGLKSDLSGLASDARNSISTALPTNPLQDIENDLKAPTGSVEQGALPAAATVEDQLPPPGDLESHPFEAIENEVRSATAQLDAGTPEAKIDAKPTVAAAAASPAMAGAKPKRARTAAKPVAEAASGTAAAPKRPAIKRAPRKPAGTEPEVAEAVAALDARPEPMSAAAKPARPAAKPRVKAKPTSGNEGPAA